MQANRSDMPFVVYYWQQVGTSADTDTETGASLSWGIDLKGGYTWRQVDATQPSAFAEILRQDSVHYLVSNGWKGGFAPLLDAAKGLHIPCGLRIDSVIWDKPFYELWLRRVYLSFAYRHFSHFFSSGKVGDAYLAKMGVATSKWKRWPYCVDTTFFARTPITIQQGDGLRQRYGLNARPIVLGICKWVDRENPVELLQAFTRLGDTGTQLVMIGDGPLRPDLEKIAHAHPHLKIVFPGYVPYVELPGWYAITSVFVHPAAYEPWGVSIHEAIASGCAVIGSNRVGSGYDMIRQGQNGFMYPLGETAALCSFMQKAMELPDEKVQEANQQMLSQWNYAEMAKGFEGFC
jgi:glycosyltransferase involved in cell wall biosynthesis